MSIVTIKSNLVFLVGLLAFATASAAELTEEAVREIISKVEKASNSQNIQGISDVLSNNFEIEGYITRYGQKEFSKKSKQEYLQMLKDGWAIYTHYESNVSNIVIKIKNNKAFVTSNVSESATYQGRTMTAHSKQEVTLEVVNGVLLVTKIFSDTIVKD